MTNSIGELEHSPFIFAIGTNTTESHPVIAVRIKMAVKKGARLLVADPRRIDLTRFAYKYLPMKIGSDVALINAMCQVIIAENLQRQSYIDERTEGFAALKAHLAEWTPERASEITGLTPDDIRQAARDYATTPKAAICYTLGITEHRCGVNNVQALGNLALLTGNLGVESAGVNPFRGQNNVQGTGDMGCMPGSLPGYEKLSNPVARARVEKAWGVGLPEKEGFKKPEAIDAILEGKVKAMWVMGDNTVVADTDSEKTVAAFRKLDFLVVQDLFLTRTAQEAHVVFPAAAFAELDGTYANSERRVQRVRKAVEPPGEAKPDWWIVQEVSKRFGFPMNYKDSEEIWNEVSSLAPTLTGISYARIDKVGIQWPCDDADHPGTKFLHGDGFPIGKAKLVAIDYLPPAEVPDADYPFMLTTGRRLSTYHTGTQTGRAKHFDRLVDQEYLELNPHDASALGVVDNEMISLASRRGRITMAARISERSPRGVVFCTFHFPEKAWVNLLSSTALDPTTKTPEFKACAVKVEKMASGGGAGKKVAAV